ncbi:terminal uridylyltransferase Tailor-like [Rhopalosiphum maidis]|uniref:terminal uridylyltransferase Tailor-like n=1 Tax=Rhopalosiphum maidis TaxID=43146 RepID=UPI000F005D7B|nr:terminal uridylyltransferase Tailor-like [Rhopalosiphum maidis]XP_026819822.1 terminal uridylyltransferase Tailor-like [Rhopalosiphum maidis]
MNNQCVQSQISSENLHHINTKRPLQLDECYNPYKFKSREIGYYPYIDIVTLIKLELQSILMNSENKKTIITDILPYGSRILGLNIDNSDVDLSIMYVSKTSVKDVMKSFANKLRQSQVFIKVFPLFYVKIPIIKCIHKNTGIYCDISFNNMSGVHNSHVINYILSIDHRIKPVLMKLKIWAKNIGLIDAKGFSSYSIYWLGLFNMQVMGILPPLHDLQKSVPEILVNQWNYAFPKNKQEYIINKQETLNVSDIFNVFCTYYLNFDFDKFVISPYTGCPILKKDFEDVEKLPEELWRYKQFYKENKECHELLLLNTKNNKNTKFKIYIQDPFQHNVNITERVEPKIFNTFINACVELKS